MDTADKLKGEVKDGLASILIQEMSYYSGEVMTLANFYSIAQEQVDWLESKNVLKEATP